MNAKAGLLRSAFFYAIVRLKVLLGFRQGKYGGKTLFSLY
jgi:hypothetical protein